MSKTLTQTDLKAALAASEAALRDSLNRLGGTNALGARAVDTAKAHPVMATMIGAGIAWLALSGRKTASPEPRPESLARWEDEGGLPVDAGEIGEEAEDWLRKAKAARDAAETRLRGLYEDGRASAEDKARVAMTLAQDLSEAFRDNLSDLSQEAAEKVAEARERAWDALTKGRDRAAAGVAAGSETVRSHPLTSTAVGLGLGALLAAAFPRTRPLVKAAAPVAASALMVQAAAVLLRERSLDEKARAAAQRMGRKAEETIDGMAQELEIACKKAGESVSDVKKPARDAAADAKSAVAH